MGQGTEVKTRADPKVEIQEKGEVFFFYRPKVDKEEAHSPDDVQRMYVVLRPESVPDRAVEEKQAPDSGKEGKKRKTRHGGDDKGQANVGNEGGHGKEEVNVEEKPLLRLIVMGKKSLPDPAKHGRPFWGYVDLVTTDIEDIKDALKGTGVRHGDARQAAPGRGEGDGRGRVPHRQARGPRRPPAHPPRVQARAALARRRRRRRRGAAGGHERGAGGVVPGADQEPRAARRGPRRRRRLRRAAGQAEGRVPGAPAGAVREQPLRAGRPAGPAQLRGVRAAADLGVRRRRGGAGPGAADGDGGRDREVLVMAARAAALGLGARTW